MSVILHLAGPEVEAQGRYLRQRCSWCGALLLDYDLASVSRTLDEDEDPENPRPWRPGVWAVGSFVAVDDHEGWRAAHLVEPEPHPDHPGAFRMPDGSCMDLDPAATA